MLGLDETKCIALTKLKYEVTVTIVTIFPISKIFHYNQIYSNVLSLSQIVLSLVNQFRKDFFEMLVTLNVGL